MVPCRFRESVATIRELNIGKRDNFFTENINFKNPLVVTSNILPQDSSRDVPREGWQHRNHSKGPHSLQDFKLQKRKVQGCIINK